MHQGLEMTKEIPINLKDLNKDGIERMNYNKLIALVRETNRPPGGARSIFYILNRLFVNDDTKILEIGTSTGFTALEIARLTKSQVTAIDINELALEEGKRRAKAEGLTNIEFKKIDVRKLSFADNSFDLVFCGNIFSIIDNKEKAFEELRRVTKKRGYIVAIPMYYIRIPPKDLVKQVSNAIGINLTINDKKFWLNFFTNPYFEFYFVKDFVFDNIEEIRVKEFVKNILSRDHLKVLSKEAFETLERKYMDYMLLFRKNLSYMGYSIIILRKTQWLEDQELFTSYEA